METTWLNPFVWPLISRLDLSVHKERGLFFEKDQKACTTRLGTPLSWFFGNKENDYMPPKRLTEFDIKD
jgi:hypothetical protein